MRAHNKISVLCVLKFKKFTRARAFAMSEL